MNRHRRASGFLALGSLHPRELGFPERRSKELRLAHAWRRVAGEPLASRARATRVVRGVLHIHVEDPRWAPVVRRVLPRLAGRLSGSFPELGVKKLRLEIKDAGEPSCTRTVAPEPPDAPGGSARVEGRSRESSRAGKPRPAIEELANRYMERAREQPR